MKRFLPVLLLASVVTASAAASGWGEIPRPPSPPGASLGALTLMADEIGLTEAQEMEINELVDASRLESAVDRERMSQIREQIQALSQSEESFDSAAAEALADEMAAIASRLALSNAELRWEIRHVLTAEQRELLDAARSGRRHRFTRNYQDADI